MNEESSVENWGNETLALSFRRTVDPNYIDYGRAGPKPVTKIRAHLLLGKLMVGGYETTEGSSKVKVYYGRGYTETVSSEEEAKKFLIGQFK